MSDNQVGIATIHLSRLEFGNVHDLWLDLDPPSSSSYSPSALAAPLFEGSAKPPKRPSLGKIHVILQKVNDERDGMLSFYGKPLKNLPLRLAPGDIVLFNNSELLRQPIKIATNSEVRCVERVVLWCCTVVVVVHGV